MYASQNSFYNLYQNTVTYNKHTAKEKISNSLFPTSSQNNYDTYPVLTNSLENEVSRYYVRTLDIGNLSKDGKLENIQNLPKYQAEASNRYNLLFSQIVRITIPCNPTLRAGQLIECRFPKTSTSLQNKSDRSQASGKYIISALLQFFQSNKSYTTLDLIRDSYEINVT
jgi:hypothetical protein